MAGHYPIKVEVDGRRYTGDWSLVMGGEVCVRSAWGAHRLPADRRKPELVTKEALGAIAASYHRARADERLLQEREAAQCTLGSAHVHLKQCSGRFPHRAISFAYRSTAALTPSMERTEDYRRNSRECRDLAAKMPEVHRQQLLEMADQWERLAEERTAALAEGRDPIP